MTSTRERTAQKYQTTEERRQTDNESNGLGLGLIQA